jgi:hypothetical protein
MCESIGLSTRNIKYSKTDPGALTGTQIEKLRRNLYA